MNLGELIVALKPLISDAEANASAIVELLDRHRSLAEFEVARFFVSQSFAPIVERRARSQDPTERAVAARAIATVMARAPAARLLRILVKDADSIVRSHARTAVRRLGLDDVALPDTQFRLRSKRPGAIGGWNPTGWSFGLYKGRYNGNGPKAQLTRTGDGAVDKPALPKIASLDALAAMLGVDERQMRALRRPGEGTGSPYVAFQVPKATGGVRTIHAPRARLKKIQRRILDEIVAKIPTHDACHGFVRGRSVATNAAPHVKPALVVKVDLVDFFPTIHFRRVAGLFEYYGYAPQVAHGLAALVTHRASLPSGRFAWPGALPQGAPTSPAIANAVCRRLDARLVRLAEKVGAKYTRYADDLTFSFAEAPKQPLGRFLWWVDQICGAEGFTENAKKRRVLRRSAQQRVTGVVVNDKPTIPRERRRLLRAMIHRLEKQRAEGKLDRALLAEAQGLAAFVNMVQPDAGAALVAQVKAIGAGT